MGRWVWISEMVMVMVMVMVGDDAVVEQLGEKFIVES